MKNLDAKIRKTSDYLKELRQLRRDRERERRAALPKHKPGRKQLAPEILERAEQLAEKMPLTEVALQCSIALRSLYYHGISRKALEKKKAARIEAACQ